MDYRKDFPLLRGRDIVYLDNAATTQKPCCVLEAEQHFYENCNANPLRGLYDLGIRATQIYEDARETVRDFIHAPRTEEIIFTRNTTESINLVAYSYALMHLKAGDEILVSIMEHHSNLLPWQMVAKQTGAKLVFLKCQQDGSILEEDIEKAVTTKTKLAAIAHVSNVLGSENPIAFIAKKIHSVEGVLLVDAAQSAPHKKIDVQELDADFLAFSGHKLLAPMGIGVLYGKKQYLEMMPPFLLGGEMIESVTTERTVFAKIPHKFEAGTMNAAGAAGLAAAIHYMEEIGMENIEKQELALTEQLLSQMKGISYVHIAGSENPKNHCGIVSFTVDGVHPHDIASIMDEAHIAIRAGHHCAQPLLSYLGIQVAARVSLSFYNTEEDIERFAACLKTVRGRMGYGE